MNTINENMCGLLVFAKPVFVISINVDEQKHNSVPVQIAGLFDDNFDEIKNTYID